jgi:hypothetical protein
MRKGPVEHFYNVCRCVVIYLRYSAKSYQFAVNFDTRKGKWVFLEMFKVTYKAGLDTLFADVRTTLRAWRRSYNLSPLLYCYQRKACFISALRQPYDSLTTLCEHIFGKILLASCDNHKMVIRIFTSHCRCNAVNLFFRMYIISAIFWYSKDTARLPHDSLKITARLIYDFSEFISCIYPATVTRQSCVNLTTWRYAIAKWLR